MAECQGIVFDRYYSAEQRPIVEMLQGRGFAALAWVITEKGQKILKEAACGS